MAVEQKLSEVLAEFARTLLTDFSIQAILDHLVERIVHVLPIDAVGVTLLAPGLSPRYVAASRPDALLLERLQSDLNEGPCTIAYATGEPVAIADLRNDTRFAQFSPRAVADGLMAVFTFPLHYDDERLGALDLYRMTPGPLSAEATAAAQVLADVAAAYLLNAQARTELNHATRSAQHSALHDPLTGLPNRALLVERLEHAITRCGRSELSVVILYIDLDRFKSVNDTYGHAVGDQLLRAVAGRLIELFRPGDTVARLAGDEFIILCEELAEPSLEAELAQRIERAMAEPFVLSGTEVQISASVGVAFAGPGSDVPDQILEDADAAMYLAKRRGGAGHTTLDIRDTRASTRRTKLNHDLRYALERAEISCVYQAIVVADTGAVMGAEALVRWAHPRQGIVMPDTLIPLAEHSGVINPLGRWVLARACVDRNQWAAHLANPELEISVNVSARQLLTPGFAASAADVLAQTGTDAHHVMLEITESVFVHDVEQVLQVLHELKAVGVSIALDDFGTGYSSLSYLKRFPVDILKIDRMFVADVDHDQGSRLIVGSVIALAHELDITVIAEGVETLDQQRVIADLGCDMCQGYLFARPTSADGFEALTPPPTVVGSLPA